MRKLTDALAATDMPARTRRLLALCPGALCGCVPTNYDAFVERVDCPTCSQILDAFDEITTLQNERSRRVKEVCGPVRARNAERMKEYAERKHAALFRFLVRKPKLEAEPPYRNEEWCRVPDRRCDELLGRIETLKAACVPHWGDKAGVAISKAMVSNNIRKDNWYEV